MDLNRSLRMALADRNMKKGELAKKAGVSKQQVSNWFRTGTMKSSTLERVCKVLGYSVSEFISLGEDDG